MSELDHTAAAAAPPLEISAMPGHLIRRMHQASMAIFDAAMIKAGFDLTSVQFAALTAIAAQPGLDQATLAGVIAFDRVTTGGVVDRLEAKNYVRREITSSDRRSRRLHLQPGGETALAGARPVVHDIQIRILAGLSAEEGLLLLHLLQKALGAIGDARRVPSRAAARD